MKKITLVITVGFMLVAQIVSMPALSYASDWDKAGKAFAVIEGIRVLSGGNVDIIGTITGINRNNRYALNDKHNRYPAESEHRCAKCVWVPHLAWEKKYIPRHKEHSKEYGTIIVEGHYILYQVEKGGHWDSQGCDHKGRHR